MLSQRVFGAAGNEILIENSMHGEEVSCSSSPTATMAPVGPGQDHKRLDSTEPKGPNTGGMVHTRQLPSGSDIRWRTRGRSPDQ